MPWLQLDDELRVRGRGLAVYPTSAPRATLGGWRRTGIVEAMTLRIGWTRTSWILNDRPRRHRKEDQNSEDRGGHKKPTTGWKGDSP